MKPDQLEELKSLFNYCSPKSIEELRFAQLYDKWFATKQIGKYFVNGRLQVSLTPLNDDLSLNTENIKYLHTNQIQDLKLDLELYGFNGELYLIFHIVLKKKVYGVICLIIRTSFNRDKISRKLK